MPHLSNKRRRSAVSLAILLAAASLYLAPFLAAGFLLSSPAAAKDGGSQSGDGGGGSDSGNGSDSGGSDNSGRGHSGEDSGQDGGGDRGAHDVRRAVSGFTVEVKTEGSDVEVIYPDGWKEEIRAGVFQLRDPAGRTVVERQATPADIARLSNIAR